ncbi:Clavesin-1 [Eumeta japonica]|uniref:Clavesin-1 n=1 Tax=Eumeta variegata TaxID=151549 RepID=A0A4C1U5Y2_EUMVA|nr:Clavesin-1 [Eumeta japonica]
MVAVSCYRLCKRVEDVGPLGRPEKSRADPTVSQRGEVRPYRDDDAYLLRFLRARRSIPARAHRLAIQSGRVSCAVLYIYFGCVQMVRYYAFRAQNEPLWRDVDAFGLARLGRLYEGVLYDRPDVGRLIILRIAEWDLNEISIEDVAQGGLCLLEVGIMSPRLQVLGGTCLIDCEGLTMRHVRQYTPSIAMQFINIMGLSFPLHQRGMHVINCSRIFETFFHFFKRLAPADDLWKHVHFHGYDLNSLHRYIDPECLPKRYGGHRESVSLETWLNKIKYYKNEEFDKDMRNLGYYVK